MITQEEYQKRRQVLCSQLKPGSIAIIPSAVEVLRNGDAHYRFRQDSNFYYLTGFNEPDSVLCLYADDKIESYLFNRPRDPSQEQWTGRRLGQDNAPHVLNVTKAYSIENFAEELPNLLASKTAVYFPLGKHEKYEDLVLQTLQFLKNGVRKGIKCPAMLGDLEPIINEMRLFKSEAEIQLMRQAAQISIKGHKKALQKCREFTNERQLEAELLYSFIQEGARNTAYDCIIGCGENSTILHYNQNDNPLIPGALVLIDAGCEFDNYASDITRTFPVTGQFTEEQRLIYELVLKAQKAGISIIKPGIQFNKIQEVIVKILTQGLVDLGLLEGNVEELIENEAYKPFYMHNSGHWLGLDVHDAGIYKVDGDWRELRSGMVLTVEPGIYISKGLLNTAERWWNIGVRIEDDILVTEEGYENLTADLPVEVDDIEALMRGN